MCIAYLEALVGLLTAGNVLSSAWHGDDGDVVVVGAQELLRARNDVAHHNSSSQRENNMLVVGMQNKATVHLAYFRQIVTRTDLRGVRMIFGDILKIKMIWLMDLP